jgi:hypothetical protein
VTGAGREGRTGLERLLCGPLQLQPTVQLALGDRRADRPHAQAAAPAASIGLGDREQQRRVPVRIDDPVDGAAALGAGLIGADLASAGGLDREAKLLLERPADRAADGVVLPAGGRGDLLDRSALGTLEHLDHLGLLGAGARCGLIALAAGRSYAAAGASRPAASFRETVDCVAAPRLSAAFPSTRQLLVSRKEMTRYVSI